MNRDATATGAAPNSSADREASCAAVATSTGRLSSGAGSRATEAPASVVKASRPSRASTTPSAPAPPRHQQAFDQELDRELAAGGADRRADRELAAAMRQARQQQTAHVGAGDQHDEGHRAEQHERRPSHAGRRLGMKARGVETASGRGVLLVLALDLLPDRMHLFGGFMRCRHPGAGDPACAGSTGRAARRAGRR